MIYLKYGQLVPGGGWAVERQLGCCSQAPCLLRNAQLRKAFENMRASENTGGRPQRQRSLQLQQAHLLLRMAEVDAGEQHVHH